MDKRTLRLRKEVLAELAAEEMSRVGGGTHLTCNCTAQLTHELCQVPRPGTLPVALCLSIAAQCSWGCGFTQSPSCAC